MEARKYNISFEPENETQLQMVKAFLKSVVKLPFKITKEERKAESPYNPEFVAKIQRGEKQFKNGDYTTFKNTEELKKFYDVNDL